MKKELLIGVTIGLLALLLAGIDACPPAKEVAFATIGLSMRFVEREPPESVVIGQEFPISVILENKGGSGINRGEAKLYLMGIGPNLLGVTPSLANTKFLEKETGSEKLYFAKAATSPLELEKTSILPIFLISCYSYGTVAQVDVCITANNASKVCSLAGEKIGPGSNSAAPLQVSSLTEELIGNKLKISFVIENMGNGAAYQRNTDCDKLHLKDRQEEQKLDKVNVRVSTAEPDFSCRLLSEEGITIDGLEGIVNLKPVGRVVCEKTLTGREDHATPFTINLLYKYKDSISKTITLIPA